MLLALHGAGLVSVWYTAAPLPIRWALMGCVAVHALHMVAEQALLVGAVSYTHLPLPTLYSV